MKGLLIFVLSFIAAESMTIQEQRQMLVGIAQECKSIENASDNDLSLLILKKPMNTKEGKCFFTCILEQVGIIQDGKWDENAFLEFVAVALNNDEGKLKKVESIARKCQSLSDPDRCENANKGIDCLRKGLKKEKIDIGF